ncbi:MAG: hypothetical protein ACRETC_01090 [Gammaproteobacteria bacterium]
MRAFNQIRLLLFVCGLLGCGVVWANPAKTPVAACQGQVRSRTSKTGPQVATIKPGLICFSGNIDKTSAQALIGAIEKVPPGQPLTLVTEGSNGGRAAFGIGIAEVLSSRDTTVIAQGMCASSCANYLWLMANHRIIADRALVVFHGGMTLALLPGIDKKIEVFAQSHPNINAKKFEQQERAKMEKLVRRQDALLTKAGVEPDFFEFFDRIGSPATATSASADCKAKPNAQYLVFSPKYLKSKGVKIESNQGPKTAAELNADLKRFGHKASSEICFWN